MLFLISGINRTTFLGSMEAQRIITTQWINRFQENNGISKSIWAKYIMDCWLSTFYHIIILPRNRLVYESKDRMRQQLPLITQPSDTPPPRITIRLPIAPPRNIITIPIEIIRKTLTRPYEGYESSPEKRRIRKKRRE